MQEQQLTRSQQGTLKSFISTYIAFVSTLADTYTEEKDLHDHRVGLSELAESEKCDLVMQWWQDIEPHVAMIQSTDAGVFACGVPCLLRLSLPQLWVADKLSPASKNYAWMYLQSLTKNSDAFVNPTDAALGLEETTALVDRCKDIQPPMAAAAVAASDLPDFQSIPGMKQVYESMPAGIIDRVKSIAERYGGEIDSGEKNISDIKFNEISQELFQGLKPEDMQGLVANVSQALQSLSGDQDGNLADLFNLMNVNQTK